MANSGKAMQASTSIYGNLWPKEATAGEIIYPPGSSFGPRIQTYFQLVILYSGHMTVWIDGIAHFAAEKTVSILFPGHEEHFIFAEESETHHSWIHIALPQLPSEICIRLEQLPRPLPLSPAMQQLIHDALAMRNASLPTAGEIVKAQAAQMLWLYIGEAEMLMRKETAPAHPAVEKARQFIQEHLGETLTLDILASAVAVSPSHLVRLFQAQLHTTPIAYLWDRRVARGIELLEQTGLTVKTIAERCGFQTSYHFSRRIRQAVGYGPVEVRRRSWRLPGRQMQRVEQTDGEP
jgi:AraC-like DNA-binding protein/quercetin dioxygenase-like cupin family protein